MKAHFLNDIFVLFHSNRAVVNIIRVEIISTKRQ
jgi:hypothetical protein